MATHFDAELKVNMRHVHHISPSLAWMQIVAGGERRWILIASSDTALQQHHVAEAQIIMRAMEELLANPVKHLPNDGYPFEFEARQLVFSSETSGIIAHFDLIIGHSAEQDAEHVMASAIMTNLRSELATLKHPQEVSARLHTIRAETDLGIEHGRQRADGDAWFNRFLPRWLWAQTPTA